MRAHTLHLQHKNIHSSLCTDPIPNDSLAFIFPCVARVMLEPCGVQIRPGILAFGGGVNVLWVVRKKVRTVIFQRERCDGASMYFYFFIVRVNVGFMVWEERLWRRCNIWHAVFLL